MKTIQHQIDTQEPTCRDITDLFREACDGRDGLKHTILFTMQFIYLIDLRPIPVIYQVDDNCNLFVNLN